MNKPLRAFIDVETTGVDENLNEIHQLVTVIADHEGKYIAHQELKIRPDNPDRVEQSALDVCNMTIDDLLANPLSQKEAFAEFTAFLQKHVDRFDKSDKLQFVAYNSDFDERFIRGFYRSNNDNYYGSYFYNPSICVMKFAAFYVADIRSTFANFKLQTVCRSFGIEFDEEAAHDALYDVKKTIHLYRHLYDSLFGED